MEFKVAVIGLGYVGLPLAVESGRTYKTIGFDINTTRISELREGTDRTQEVDKEDLLGAKHLTFSSEPSDLSGCNFYIVTVPTPVDQHKKPDLSPIISASRMISSFLKKGDIVVYESTVYPGCTEEMCVPELEKSGLVFNEDFFCGYSPERINPGDKVHRLTTILKVTSGSNPETAETVDHFYKSIVTAGTYKASSIKVAEAAKVIENSQRDINIAFVNELSLIFDRVGIDTQEVLEAAGTKWNFLKFTPGLVGGHCIGVDPFYLTYKAEELGYHPQVILSGRKINDNMGAYVAQRTIKLLSQKKKLSQQTKVLILGITFKENCPDIRNSRVIDIYRELVDFGVDTDVFDPNADQVEVSVEYGINMLNEPVYSSYEAIILAVAHGQFLELDWSSIRNNISVIFDVKGLLPKEFVDSRL
ncbi:nucleotide sugar dehydrogenase [Marinoscillum luteum]|uniref:Nucleotide sugar dehydrogenase n=1 Tax=Marinoscillum luteum TaxID=861051 RepID=A0ABW7ND41_9BACT